ncbi:hypothetical protein SAMD00023353_0301970 [Rosellinia necatrix]|uniref:Uncharacterized protein n=1 Tax=Rosellinia necatrix TaxID=77044 RepID=A0A1S8A5C3_ROSNE|nr:hypothetical protein SAMD00023353_0301970 [Rosellinia necatrix]
MRQTNSHKLAWTNALLGAGTTAACGFTFNGPGRAGSSVLLVVLGVLGTLGTLGTLRVE